MESTSTSPSLPQIELTAPGIMLRTYRLGSDDAPLYEAIRSSQAGLWPWLPWAHPEYAQTDTTEYLAGRPAAWHADEEWGFLICDPADGSIVGGCGLNHIDRAERRANLGYWVRHSHLRQGFAHRATRRVARWGLEEQGLERIEILVAVDNFPSRSTALAAGARFEGIARARVIVAGQMRDAACYSLTRADLWKLR